MRDCQPISVHFEVGALISDPLRMTDTWVDEEQLHAHGENQLTPEDSARGVVA